MNLLFDENISFRIVKKLQNVFPGAKQVKELNLENASDFTIWDFAGKHNFCIVTFDSDFIDISALKGTPPKVIWLRFGNTATDKIAERLQAEAENIIGFLKSTEIAFLEIK